MPDRLAEIRARLDAATALPPHRYDRTLLPDERDREARAVLNAHAPAYIAWLLDEVEQQRQEIDRLR